MNGATDESFIARVVRVRDTDPPAPDTMLVRVIALLDRVCEDDGNVYVAREFTDDMTNKVLPDSKVVRPRNGRFFYQQELKEMIRAKSNMNCPTYGTCAVCLSSGPTAMECQSCRQPQNYYCIAEGPYRQKILDSEWISRLVGATHMPARGDRTVTWDGPIPTTLVDHSRIKKHLWTIYHTDTPDAWNDFEQERCAAHAKHYDLYRQGVNTENKGVWDVLGKTVPGFDPMGHIYLSDPLSEPSDN
jgi:hypothetical protein